MCQQYLKCFETIDNIQKLKNMSFAISKKYKNTDWNNLNLVNETSLGWLKGIDIIKDRFESRFFDHIDIIKNDKFSGFLIMSIDCLLIETLMQFYLGVENTEKLYKSKQWESFKDFLKNSIYFKSDFRTNKICHVFYQHFRCGLLHQAQTKSGSLIKIYRDQVLELKDPNNINNGLIIDRKKFHSKLKLEFEDYLKKLTNNKNNFKGQNLRLKAIEKMNSICA